MKYKKAIIIITAIFLLMPLFFTSAATTGMRNPAAAYCVDLGYEYDIKKTPEGEYGVCKFPDGSEAMGWKFFAGQEKREYNFCAINGYGTKTVSDERCAYNSKCALCILEDGTEKEVTSLMKLEVVANDQEQIEEEEPDKKDYFKIIAICLTSVLIIGLIFAIIFRYKKIKNKK